jgi:dTDP-4-amino-4,6-dideoxygalactose transaminase
MIDHVLTALSGCVWPSRYSAASTQAYEQAVESFFGAGKAVAFWKGRIAFYAILKAMGIGPGDEVIVPGYTCVMVPGPVIYAGAKPVYADIEPNGYGVNPDEVARKITPRTKAILAQHTYGLPGSVKEIRRIADRRGIALIEDCCHTFGGRVDRQLLGAFGKAAFFSGQWNKPFYTGLGGLALVHDEELARRVKAEQARYPAPSRRAAFMLAGELLAYETMVYPATTAMLTRAFRWMTQKGWVVGSSNKAEFECPLHPKETDQTVFGYHDGDCPVAEKAAREVINLPTHRRVAAKDIERTLDFVRAVCRPAQP